MVEAQPLVVSKRWEVCGVGGFPDGAVYPAYSILSHIITYFPAAFGSFMIFSTQTSDILAFCLHFSSEPPMPQRCLTIVSHYAVTVV